MEEVGIYTPHEPPPSVLLNSEQAAYKYQYSKEPFKEDQAETGL
jgi:hypothetical protein